MLSTRKCHRPCKGKESLEHRQITEASDQFQTLSEAVTEMDIEFDDTQVPS